MKSDFDFWPFFKPPPSAPHTPSPTASPSPSRLRGNPGQPGHWLIMQVNNALSSPTSNLPRNRNIFFHECRWNGSTFSRTAFLGAVDGAPLSRHVERTEFLGRLARQSNQCVDGCVFSHPFFLNTKVKWASLGVKLVLLKLPCPTTFTSLFVSREAFNWFNYLPKTYTFNKKTYLGICLQPFAKIFGFNILLKVMKTGAGTSWLEVLQ